METTILNEKLNQFLALAKELLAEKEQIGNTAITEACEVLATVELEQPKVEIVEEAKEVVNLENCSSITVSNGVNSVELKVYQKEVDKRGRITLWFENYNDLSKIIKDVAFRQTGVAFKGNENEINISFFKQLPSGGYSKSSDFTCLDIVEVK